MCVCVLLCLEENEEKKTCIPFLLQVHRPPRRLQSLKKRKKKKITPQEIEDKMANAERNRQRQMEEVKAGKGTKRCHRIRARHRVRNSASVKVYVNEEHGITYRTQNFVHRFGPECDRKMKRWNKSLKTRWTFWPRI